MSPKPPSITVRRIDERRRAFLTERPIPGDEAGRFSCAAAEPRPPVAAAVLGVPGIEAVEIAGTTLTAEAQPGYEWSDLEEAVRYAMATVLSGAGAPAADARGGDDVDDDDLFDRVSDIFEAEINPAVAQHGGRVDLIDVQDATVIVRMQGGCQGCGMANVTLKQGIEATLKRALPALKGVEDITDHAAGTDPYFNASKK